MDKTNIKTLSGSEKLYISEKGKGVKVVDGRINIFMVPFIGEERGRSKFLLTAEPGDLIPSLFYSAPTDMTGSDYADWMLYAVSETDESLLTAVYCNREDEEKFCTIADIEMSEDMEYGEALVEYYNLDLIRDMRNIFVSKRANSASKERPLKSIYNIFSSKINAAYCREQTESMLFNAASVVCNYMNLEYAPLSKVIMANGRNFDIFDFARISGFACRKVILSEGWEKMDIGPILGFFGDDKVPVACIPKGRGFVIYFSDTGELRKLDRTLAEQLRIGAFMFYRRFPRENMNMKKILRFALPVVRKKDVLSIFILGLFSILIGLLIPFINEQIYDLFIPTGDGFDLACLGGVIVACTLGNVSFMIVQSFCNFRVTYRMKYSVEAAGIDRLFNLPQSFIDKYESADLAKRVLYLPDIFGVAVQSILQCGVTMIFSLLYLVRMFKFNSKLTWTSLIVLACFCIIVYFLGMRQVKYEQERDDWARKNNSMLFQLLNGIARLRIAGAEERGIEQYMNGFIEESKVNLKAERLTYLVTILSTAVSTVFSMIFFYMVMKSGGEISTGQFMGFVTAFGGLSGAVMQCASQWLVLNNVIPYYRNAKVILEAIPEKQEEGAVPADLLGGIEVNNITFGYDPEAEPILKNISFKIRPGEHIGIVGSSGCGKSTLMKILLGFEKSQLGKVYYDDQDMDSLDKRELRKRMGVVLQNGGIISGSIYDNVVISRPHATRKQVEEAIEMAGLADDVKEMPMGINTVLSEGSGGISGGQKQRVLIARAVVGKPKVLLFDEATSALDNNTQAAVCESLEKLSATRLVIAHRLSTVMNCDRIFVMDNGTIVEEGNYETLMEQKGLFYELAKMQIK